MAFSVELQPAMNFSKWVLVLGIVFVAAGIALFIFAYLYHQKNTVPEENRRQKPTGRQARNIRQESLDKLTVLRRKVKNNEISVRDAYQQLSEILRDFSGNVSGWIVEQMTLEELKYFKLTKVASLIQEYYEPEFAEKTQADALKSIDRTRKVIRSWR